MNSSIKEVKKLHPNAKWLFRMNYYPFVFAILLMLFLSFVSYFLFGKNPALVLMMIILSIFLVIITVFAEVFARLQYKNWAYEFTEHELKKERGIIFKRYSSVPYERIQNVEIHRGILARMFGFSSLNIHTAGFSGVSAAEGSIPALGIEEAEEIRAFLMKEISGVQQNE